MANNKKRTKRPRKPVARKKQVKKAVKKSFKKTVEMIKTSEGTSDCQAISVTFHDDAPTGLIGGKMLLPSNTYYQQTSRKNTIASDGPALGSRISGNSVYSKYLNFRFKLSFMDHGVPDMDDATRYPRVGRYRVLAGVFHNAPDLAVPWLGWINGQGGVTSPAICDSDFEGVQWKTNMENELKTFYNSEKIWGGLTEKARWTLIHDKVYKSNPKTAVQLFSGQTEASADGKALVAGATVFTRPDIEGFIDFSKTKACNKKLYYGPNVISSLPANHAQNQSAIYNPSIQGDRGLAATTGKDVPFVYIMNISPDPALETFEPDLSFRWCHYFQDA